LATIIALRTIRNEQDGSTVFCAFQRFYLIDAGYGLLWINADYLRDLNGSHFLG
jgi:hypothetical protein